MFCGVNFTAVCQWAVITMIITGIAVPREVLGSPTPCQLPWHDACSPLCSGSSSTSYTDGAIPTSRPPDEHFEFIYNKATAARIQVAALMTKYVSNLKL